MVEPFYKVDGIQQDIKYRNQIVEAGKSLFVKSFPGPVNNLVRIGGDMWSSKLVPGFPYPQPKTNLEMQQAYKDLLDFPLAVYLCAFQGPGIYFMYSAWYDIRQNVPCRLKPENCHFPMDFDQLLNTDPGLPLTDPTWDEKTCSRVFENLSVSVNIEDSTSVIWGYNF